MLDACEKGKQWQLALQPGGTRRGLEAKGVGSARIKKHVPSTKLT